MNNYNNNIFCRLFSDHERLKMIVFLLFAFSILAVSFTFFTLSLGRPYMGITLSMNDKGWTVESVDTNSLAAQAGIQKGDTYKDEPTTASLPRPALVTRVNYRSGRTVAHLVSLCNRLYNILWFPPDHGLKVYDNMRL